MNHKVKMDICNVIFRTLFVYILAFVYPGTAETSLTEKIYYNLNSTGFSMCFRRFNATHQIGCSSDRGGNVGVIHLIMNYSDVEWLEQNGTHSPYVAVMNTNMFSRDVFDRLVRSKKINGLVVIGNETDRPDNFSPDSSCPNSQYGLYSGKDACKNISWNPFGNRMMFEDVPFPMVALSNESDISFIIENCYKEFNKIDVADMPKGYSFCAMEIKDVMDGAKDTPTCIRRSNIVNNLERQYYCDPLSNWNIYSYMRALNRSHVLENGSVIVIAARLDAFSLFERRYPGYDSAVLGFITVHAIAQALGNVKDELQDVVYNQPIMFALFHGEAFEYIGSSRMVYDIERQKFLPVTLESIGMFIEIGQVGLHEGLDSLWIHTDPFSINKSEVVYKKVKDLTNTITKFAKDNGLNVSTAPEENLLPPSSLHQFLKAEKTSIAGILLSNHKENFTNRYYNSMYDMSDDMSNASDPEAYNRVTPVAEHLQKISTSIAQTVYSLLIKNASDVDKATSDNVTIANLIYCFTKNSNCELLNTTSEYGKSKYLLSPAYHDRYVGVPTEESFQATKHHQLLLAHFLGYVLENITDKEKCNKLIENKDGYNYVFLSGMLNATDNATRVPMCVKSAANLSDALSPAFEIDGYDWSSYKYSAWTESKWSAGAMQMRVFLLPNPDHEIVTLSIGIIMFVLSSLVTFFIQKKSEALFSSAET